VDAKGEFEVEITYAVAPGAGGEFEIAGLRATVSSTGSWEKFETKTIGRIRLDGRCAIRVRPVRFDHALMNLASLRLK
jgi:hypothetical protein